MKITRKHLRRLIVEAFKQKVPLFDPVSQGEIDALRQKGRQDADLANLTPKQIANLQTLDQSSNPASVDQARLIYQTFDSTEPQTSVQQEKDFLAGQDDYLSGIRDYNVAQVLEDIFINGNRNPTLLKQIGFVRVGDLPHLRPGNSDYEEFEAKFKQESRLLQKPIEDLMFIETEVYSKRFLIIKNFLNSDKRINNITEWSAYTGGDTEVFFVGNKNVALLDLGIGGYGTITI